MVSSQTLKLLDALLAGSSGSECEQLKALYKEAYCGTEAFKDLKTLLERSEFHGSAGRELLMQSEDVLRAGFSNAGHFGDSLTVMEYLVDKIQKELEVSAEYIQSATISGTSMHAVDKRLADGATEYYEKLFHYVCCFYASLYGASVLENIKVKTGIRSEQIEATNIIVTLYTVVKLHYPAEFMVFLANEEHECCLKLEFFIRSKWFSVKALTKVTFNLFFRSRTIHYKR